MIYLDLLIGFLEVGIFSFGGAYAAIPLIRDVVLAHGWMDDDKISVIIAISESTPGPIMVNMATYVGAEKGGIPGAAIATAAVVFPAFLIILFIMILLKKAMENKFMQAALSGLKPCISGIILATGVYMLCNNCFGMSQRLADIRAIVITGLLFIILYGSRMIKKEVTPIILICISAVMGIVGYGLIGY
jgi:chromate transporter